MYLHIRVLSSDQCKEYEYILQLCIVSLCLYLKILLEWVYQKNYFYVQLLFGNVIDQVGILKREFFDFPTRIFHV